MKLEFELHLACKVNASLSSIASAVRKALGLPPSLRNAVAHWRDLSFRSRSPQVSPASPYGADMKSTRTSIMKYPTTQFKSLDIALEELAPFVRNQGGVDQILETGRPTQRFGNPLVV